MQPSFTRHDTSVTTALGHCLMTYTDAVNTATDVGDVIMDVTFRALYLPSAAATNGDCSATSFYALGRHQQQNNNYLRQSNNDPLPLPSRHLLSGQTLEPVPGKIPQACWALCLARNILNTISISQQKGFNDNDDDDNDDIVTQFRKQNGVIIRR